MKAIQDYLLQKQAQFCQHRFFQQLTQDISLETFASVASGLSFWVMSFQDLLRLNEERINNEQIRYIVRKHRLEQTGQEHWFKSQILTWRIPPVGRSLSVYSPQYTTIRDATYALMAEVFQARNDCDRIILLLALESTSNIFLELTTDFIEHLEYSSHIRYFSHYDLEFAINYTNFEQSLTAYLVDIQVSEEETQQITAIINRVYDAFNLMFDGLASALVVQPKTSKMPNLVLL